MGTQPTHVDLFSGIGGFSLAARWAGFRTVLHCEIDPYCQKVLRKNFPEVPVHDDIRTLDGATLGAVDLVTGGFPCQAFSGLRADGGIADPRNLGPAMLRVIVAGRPRWVVGENVGGFIDKALDAVCSDLASAGYEVGEPLVFPALAVGADHERYRAFVVAHVSDQLVQGAGTTVPRPLGSASGRADSGWQATLCRPAPHSDLARGGHWSLQPRPVGVVDGLPRRLDKHRIAALGNAVVPQACYPILAAIAREIAV